MDPGLRFPWATLALSSIGLWPRAATAPLEGDVQAALERFGYPPAVGVTTADIVASFQRRFRPSRVDGIADPQTRALLASLLDQVGRGA
jgi:N-acetylmuramoyl-L-alanine amidase